MSGSNGWCSLVFGFGLFSNASCKVLRFAWVRAQVLASDPASGCDQSISVRLARASVREERACLCCHSLCSFFQLIYTGAPPHPHPHHLIQPGGCLRATTLKSHNLHVGAVSSSLTLCAAKCESSGSKFPWINISIWMRSVAREQNVVDYAAWWSERWWKTVWPRAAVALSSLSGFYIKRNIWLLVPNKDLKQPPCSPCWPNRWNGHLHHSLAPQ